MLCDTGWSSYLEVNVLQQVKVFSIEPQVLQDLRVVHVIGKVSRRGKVTVCHHLFGAVDNDGVIEVCSARLWLLLCTKGVILVIM